MFLDEFDVARWYGVCPHCGYPHGRCLCTTPDREPPPEDTPVAETDDDLPF